MPKVLIAGDSYASDWNEKWEWWKSLPYDITNVAQAGSSQYRILKSLCVSLDYDVIVIFHTSPYRLYTENNTLHTNSPTHKHSDYIIGDVIAKGGDISKAMKSYVKYFYNEELVLYNHRKICEDIINITKHTTVIHASGFDYDDIFEFDDMTSIRHIAETQHGGVCHMNTTGNKMVADIIETKIKNLTL